MAKYYLVVKKGLEYNDEYYDERDGYEIDSKLLKDKEQAEKIADDLNKKAVENEWYTNESGDVLVPYKVITVEE